MLLVALCVPSSQSMANWLPPYLFKIVLPISRGFLLCWVGGTELIPFIFSLIFGMLYCCCWVSKAFLHTGRSDYAFHFHVLLSTFWSGTIFHCFTYMLFGTISMGSVGLNLK